MVDQWEISKICCTVCFVISFVCDTWICCRLQMQKLLAVVTSYHWTVSIYVDMFLLSREQLGFYSFFVRISDICWHTVNYHNSLQNYCG